MIHMAWKTELNEKKLKDRISSRPKDSRRIDGAGWLRLKVNGESKNLVVLKDDEQFGFQHVEDRSVNIFDVHSFVERFNAKQGTNLKVISHEVADAALIALDVSEIRYPSFITDLVIGYEKPGTRLGKEIVQRFASEKVSLATGKFKGEKDVALVALGLRPADIKIYRKSIRLDVPDDRLIAVPDFPRRSGWYMPHAKTGVPHGKEVKASRTARYLETSFWGAYVGFIIRGYDLYNGVDYRRIVYAEKRMLDPFFDRVGVVAEFPDSDAPKIEALIKLSAPRCYAIGPLGPVPQW